MLKLSGEEGEEDLHMSSKSSRILLDSWQLDGVHNCVVGLSIAWEHLADLRIELGYRLISGSHNSSLTDPVISSETLQGVDKHLEQGTLTEEEGSVQLTSSLR